MQSVGQYYNATYTSPPKASQVLDQDRLTVPQILIDSSITGLVGNDQVDCVVLVLTDGCQFACEHR